MNRRSLLKSTLAAGAGSFLPFSSILAQQTTVQPAAVATKPGRFRQFTLGELELTILSDGYIKQSPVYPFVAPLATEAAVKKLLADNFRPTDSIELAMNVMVVKTKDRLILLDSGMGIFAGDIQGKLMENLAEAGFNAADFTDIILSHAHPDHIGGLIDKQDKLVFPNADLYMAKAEHDFWQRATLEDFKNGPLYKMGDFVKQIITGIQHVLQTIQPRLKFIDFQNGLHGVLSFQLAAGHTPGLTMTTVTSNKERLTFIADLIHSDVLLFPHPEWGFTGDTNIKQAVESRIKLLTQLTAGKTRTFAYHLPYPGIGHVRKNGTGFEWVPEVFPTA